GLNCAACLTLSPYSAAAAAAAAVLLRYHAAATLASGSSERHRHHRRPPGSIRSPNRKRFTRRDFPAHHAQADLTESRRSYRRPDVTNHLAGCVQQLGAYRQRLIAVRRQPAKVLVHVAAEMHARHHFLPRVAALGERDGMRLIQIGFLWNRGI